MQDKTLKIRAYSEPAKSEEPQGTPAKTQDVSLELEKKNAQLEEEKSKSLELLKTIVQLRESLKHEQVKTSDIVRKAAELEDKSKETAALVAKELEKKTAQLEDETKKAIEQAKVVEQLRESLRQAQAKSADFEAKLTRLSGVEENQLAKKTAQLEEEKKKSLEQARTIEELREILKEEQAKAGVDYSAELEAKTKEVAALQAKVKDLAGMLTKIASIAAMAKSDSNA